MRPEEILNKLQTLLDEAVLALTEEDENNDYVRGIRDAYLNIIDAINQARKIS